MPRLLVDTDIFCKLGIAELLEPAVALFDLAISDCRCLPALPYMLRRGKLPKLFGPEACGKLVPLAESMAAGPWPATPSLDKFTNVDRIDVGEAQILAAVADLGIIALTGDKRALEAVAKLPECPPLLAGRIVTLEAVLISLCEKVGDDVVRAALQPVRDQDRVLRVCFSSVNIEPRIGLRSYFDALKRDVVPLVLWDPVEGKL
jgi:hypothetical protein